MFVVRRLLSINVLLPLPFLDIVVCSLFKHPNNLGWYDPFDTEVKSKMAHMAKDVNFFQLICFKKWEFAKIQTTV